MQNIISHAAPHEKSSPFYKKNKKVCQNWAEFTNHFEGEIIGKYTAWALILKAKINFDNVDWIFDINKSTMTNNSMYFIIFNKKDVHSFTNIESNNCDFFLSSFIIREKKRSDMLWSKWRDGYHEIKPGLVVLKKDNRDKRLDELILQIQKISNEANLIKVKYDKSKSRIIFNFRSIMEDWDFTESLISLKDPSS